MVIVTWFCVITSLLRVILNNINNVLLQDALHKRSSAGLHKYYKPANFKSGPLAFPRYRLLPVIDNLSSFCSIWVSTIVLGAKFLNHKAVLWNGLNGQHSLHRIKYTTLRTQTVVLERKIIPSSILYWFTINRISRSFAPPNVGSLDEIVKWPVLRNIL